MTKAKNRKRRRGIIAVLVIAVFSFILSLILVITPSVQSLELQYHDRLFEWRGPLDVSDSPIVLVAMSEQADSEIPEKYPWPTHIYANLVENLNQAGAKTILFDVLFSQNDPNPENDSLFAAALKKYGNVILAGEINVEETNQSVEYSRIFPNRTLLDANPNQVGLVKMIADDIDEGVRYYRFGNTFRDGLFEVKPYYMLGIEGVRLFEGLSYDQVDTFEQTRNKEFFYLGPYNIPKSGQNAFIINFYGPEGIFPQVSLDEVIDDSTYTTVTEAEAFEMNLFDDPDIGLVHKDFFRDKIVIIGSTMPTLGDYHITPFASGSRPRPGFEIHAHAMQTILNQNYITRFPDLIILGLMLFFSFFVTIVAKFFDTKWGVLSTVLLIGGYFYLTYIAFIQMNVIMMITGPVLALLISQVGMIGFEYYQEQKEKRRIKGMFSSYVSPDLVHQMVESGEEPQLGGEEIYMTAFFSDIESFSTFSEKLEAGKLVVLINEYLNAMTDILNEQGGTLDKYIGDAIVGFFGAPVPLEEHALKSCIASQLMQKKQAELREKWSGEDWPDIVGNMKTRIGMNTGSMVTGNMGSLRRFNYTMMGDNVNLAARCESGAKQYGVYTMITESTKEEAEKWGDDCVFRLLDNIVVKGRTQPVKVYEVADLRSDADQKLFDCIGIYEEGMEWYFKQEWDQAIERFERSLDCERYEKNPSGIFLERCRLMKEDPPGDDWDGVFVMKSK